MNKWSVLIKEPVAQQYNTLRTRNYFKNCVKISILLQITVQNIHIFREIALWIDY